MNKTVIALGMFDGVHIGHQVLLRRAAEIAHADGDEAVVFTYSNHPKKLFTGSFRYVGTMAQREALMKDCGCDRVDTVPFDAAFASMSPEAFVEWLCARYKQRISAIVVGYDYRFGSRAAGNPALLEQLCAPRGIAVTVVGEVDFEGLPCASTRVREAIQNGEMQKALLMLNRPFVLCGTVVHAKALARQYGVPTANLDAGEQILPKDGVYATILVCDGKEFDAVTNVGNNPTVQGKYRTVETHAIDADLDLYGKRIGVAFFDRLRDEQVFENADALFAQIRRDAAAAKKVLQDHQKSVYNLERLC